MTLLFYKSIFSHPESEFFRICTWSPGYTHHPESQPSCGDDSIAIWEVVSRDRSTERFVQTRVANTRKESKAVDSGLATTLYHVPLLSLVPISPTYPTRSETSS